MHERKLTILQPKLAYLVGGATLNGLLGFINYMKPIEGFEGYFVGELGEFFSRKYGKEKQIKPFRSKKGYLLVDMYINGKRTHKTLHRLVAMAFVANPENKPCVNHKNGIKTDCRAVNLEWSTYAENNQHAFDTGLNTGRRKYLKEPIN